MRAPRICPTPGCPNVQPCATHARPNSHRRGYDRKHRRTRAQWSERVEAGVVKCWRCGQHIQPDEPWDLGHDDYDRTVTRGPEHIWCNRATTGRT